MCSRFGKKEEFVAEGGRGPSARRLTASTGALASVSRGGLFTSLAKRSTVDQGSLARPGSSGGLTKSAPLILEPSAEALKEGKGKLCYVCGTQTMVSGTGLRQCPECHSIQLQSGLMSRSWAMANPDALMPDGTTSRQASKKAAEERKKTEADNPVDSGVGGSTNTLACKSAWKRLSQSGVETMAFQTGAGGAESTVAPGDEKVPIMAGFVNTGYFLGDRVKTTLRLAGAQPGGLGWDPINSQTDEGTVMGPGRTPGEIMVNFDHSGVTCSMKMGHISHIKKKEATCNVDRSRARKSHLMRMPTM